MTSYNKNITRQATSTLKCESFIYMYLCYNPWKYKHKQESFYLKFYGLIFTFLPGDNLCLARGKMLVELRVTEINREHTHVLEAPGTVTTGQHGNQ